MDPIQHRTAVARRFAARIGTGDALICTGITFPTALPYTLRNDEIREFNGVNSLILLQVMADNLWTDPRFFTLEQIDRYGWALAPNAKQVALQFMAALGDDGTPLARPEMLRFHVFNGSQIAGMSSYEHLPQLRAAAPKNLDQFIPWPSAPAELESAASHEQIKRAISETFIAAQVPGFPKTRFDFDHFKLWEELILTNPEEFYWAVKDGATVASEIVRQVKLNSVENTTKVPGTRSKDGANMLDRNGKSNKTTSPRVEEAFAQRQAVLAVAYKDFDGRARVQKLGAMFYAPQAVWFVPRGLDVSQFREWDPRATSLGTVATVDALKSKFREVMDELGLDSAAEIIDDGKWHNVSVNSTNKKNNAGAYRFDSKGGKDGGAVGYVTNKFTGEASPWTYDGPLLTPEQRTKLRAEILAREAAAAAQLAREQDEAADVAQEIWEVCEEGAEHPYAKKKHIAMTGLRVVQGDVLLKYPHFKAESGATMIRGNLNYLMVPMSDKDGRLRALQAISPDGKVKSFMRGAQKKGTMFLIGIDRLEDLQTHDFAGEPAFAYAEGIATGKSFAGAVPIPTAVCFDAGNLETVAAETAKLIPQHIARILAVDNDQFHVERAVGFLTDKLGLNPHSPGHSVPVFDGAELRRVSLGEAIADGEWHECAKGTYKVGVEYESDGKAVRAMRIETVIGQKKQNAIFSNRGVEAGRTAATSIEKQGAIKVVQIAPAFGSLQGKPSDWNDKVQREGQKSVLDAVIRVISVEAPSPILQRPRGHVNSLAR